LFEHAIMSENLPDDWSLVRRHAGILVPEETTVNASVGAMCARGFGRRILRRSGAYENKSGRLCAWVQCHPKELRTASLLARAFDQSSA
jgi:hypothetical protein